MHVFVSILIFMVVIKIVVFWAMTPCSLVGSYNISKKHTVIILRVEMTQVRKGK
jgi:hypothetical protein